MDYLNPPFLKDPDYSLNLSDDPESSQMMIRDEY
jgi:hypothetical protein